MIYLDSETCGLHSMPVIFQYAEDDGPISIHEIWRRPICETLDLIERFCSTDICGFNLPFDWFHVSKIYTTLMLYPDKDAYPDEIIDELGILEERARFSNICLKPRSALDLMLVARKTKYQSLMSRDDIKIRRVPTPLAHKLAQELERRIKFDDIYFANSKDPYAPKWKVYDIHRPDGSVNPDFKDIKLKFKASGSLKNLYKFASGNKEKTVFFGEIDVDKKFHPEEVGYAPFALALAPNYKQDKNWRGTWPEMIRHHIKHWAFYEPARKYASGDIDKTRWLRSHLGNPKPGDNDSELACMVASCRWRGFAIDEPKLRELRNQAYIKIAKIPTAPKVVKRYIFAKLNDIEKMGVPGGGSTKKVVLEEISTWKTECCDKPECPECHGSGEKQHPAAIRAKEVLDARIAGKEIELYDKLLLARRFHASFKIIGTLSSRMAGADGLNPQGISHQKYVRKCFTLADTKECLLQLGLSESQADLICMDLSGGDFKSFEVCIAAAVFKDPTLDAELKSGRKIHALLGMELFPGHSYEEILASEGTQNDMYDKGKKGVFLMFYGGDANTFKNKLGIPLEIGEPAFQRFMKKRVRILEFNNEVQRKFGALVQTGGIGTKIEWREPADYAETALGFRRYFTLENKICRALFELAQSPPPSWKEVKIKVMRRDRLQTAAGAVSSALYGSAFGICSGIQRAAKNHYIQAFGAEITKATQRAIWDLQPSGIHQWYVMAINVHDELMAPNRNLADKIREAVNKTILKYREQVPLLAIDWIDNIPNWAGKKGDPNAPKVPVGNTQPDTVPQSS